MRNKKKLRQIIIITSEIFIFICCLCVFVGIVLDDILSQPPSSPPVTPSEPLPPAFSFPTNTFIPTLSSAPNLPILTTESQTFSTLPPDPRTATIQALLTQAALAQTNAGSEPTNPPAISTKPSSNPRPVLTPTNKWPPCSCSSNLYNCSYSDFSSVSEAQDCFDYCISIGAGDVHDLDRDNDGLVCEWGLSDD